MLVFAGIVPHPPLIVPEIGKDDAKKIVNTQKAYDRLMDSLVESEPDTIIIISPHMVHYPEMFNVCGMRDLYGSFKNFNFAGIEYHLKNNIKIANQIVDKSEDEGLPAIFYNNMDTEYELDHGVTIPIHFLDPKMDYPYKVLPIGYSIATREQHYAFGQIIQDVLRSTDERIAVLASGDLSHRLNNGSSDQIQNAKKFDKDFVDLIKKGDEFSILSLDEEILESAGECGYRSILILLGCLSNLNYSPEVYSYEGPFGVGYMVANMDVEQTIA